MVSYTANTEIRDFFLSNLLLLTLFDDDIFFWKDKSPKRKRRRWIFEEWMESGFQVIRIIIQFGPIEKLIFLQ